jgi:hypothetical protein
LERFVLELFLNLLPTQEGTMLSNQKEKWMELCELAANERDARKLMALIAEIARLLEVKQQRLEAANPDS